MQKELKKQDNNFNVLSSNINEIITNVITEGLSSKKEIHSETNLGTLEKNFDDKKKYVMIRC